MMLEAHETLRDHILPAKISRAEQRQQHPLAFFHPSLPPDPLTPRRQPAYRPSTAQRAQKQFPSRNDGGAWTIKNVIVTGDAKLVKLLSLKH